MKVGKKADKLVDSMDNQWVALMVVWMVAMRADELADMKVD